MNIFAKLKQLVRYIVYILVLGFCSCANRVPPTGGPFDTTPPKILNRNPTDSVLNFKGGTFTIEFDEYVKLENIQSEFQITPLTKVRPEIKLKKKSLTVSIPDSLLEKNTTYQLNFGQAVRDIRAGNIYENLNVTFSTGNYFDSLSLTGKIWQAETGTPDTAAWVVLYNASLPDSIIKKERPLYAVKSRGGIFSITGLPDKEFKIFSLSNSDEDLKYNALGERISFSDTLVKPGIATGTINLYSFVEPDNIDTNVRASKNRRGAEAPSDRTYTTNLKVKDGKNEFDVKKDLELVFKDSIYNFQKDKVRFYDGEVLDISSDAVLDSSRYLRMKADWTMESDYKLILLTGYAKDSSGVKLKGDTISFRTMGLSDYGTVKVSIDKELYKEGSILYLLNKKEVIKEVVLKDSLHSFEMLLPGNYGLRLLYDQNSNGKWDSGNLMERNQAERMLQYPGNVLVKPNWEHEAIWKKGKKKREGLN